MPGPGPMQRLRFFQVDAFTSKPFSGNPAAVVLLSTHLSDAVRLQIAAENNLSETAFVERYTGQLSDGRDVASRTNGIATDSADNETVFSTDESFRLRWFTPTTEVPMCGHATLAAAAALFQGVANRSSTLTFHTLSGPLTVTCATATDIAYDAVVSSAPPCSDAVSESGAPAHWLTMSLPLAQLDSPPGSSTEGHGVLRQQPWDRMVAHCVGQLPVQEVCYSSSHGLNYLLVALQSGTTREQLESMTPDIAAMRSTMPADIRGVIVTAAAEGYYNFLSRFFAPSMGIDEDPVTGSAHTLLGPYWARKLGKSKLRARQCSLRGGELQLSVDESGGRVLVTGQAVIVIEGHLRL